MILQPKPLLQIAGASSHLIDLQLPPRTLLPMESPQKPVVISPAYDICHCQLFLVDKHHNMPES
jgi:hypothetical protein